MFRVSGIYGIKNTLNNKIYVGQSVDLHHRKISHLSDLRRGGKENFHLQSAFDLYGESSFSFYVIEYCSVEMLNDREKFHIQRLDTTNREKGYNITEGGDNPPNFLGKSHSEDTKKKISNSAMGNTRWVGRKHKESTKEKMSKSGRGLKKKNGKSKYLGVSPSAKCLNKPWACNISYKGRPKWIGYFESEIEAARAYDRVSLELYGDDAPLNFGNESCQTG